VASAKKKAKSKSSPSKSRVFLSHSSKDKPVARELAVLLKESGFDVWFDEWEIAVGDSIVEKVFSALSASDALVILLSRASVKSRWVAEELNSSVMRRLSEGGIRVLPVLCEACTIPSSLRHIKYADVRARKGYSDLLEALEPGHGLWASLNGIFDQFCAQCDELVAQRSSSFNVGKFNSMLESATQIRTEIELRASRRKPAPKIVTLFDKLRFLETRGVETRSRAFNVIVSLRSKSYHDEPRDISIKMLLVDYGLGTTRQHLIGFLEELKQLMRGVCIRRPA
jgi:hypothetical protein